MPSQGISPSLRRLLSSRTLSWQAFSPAAVEGLASWLGYLPSDSVYKPYTSTLRFLRSGITQAPRPLPGSTTTRNLCLRAGSSLSNALIYFLTTPLNLRAWPNNPSLRHLSDFTSSYTFLSSSSHSAWGMPFCRSIIFMPLLSGGLWLPVIWIEPVYPCDIIFQLVAPVGTSSSVVSTSIPTDTNPSIIALRKPGVLKRLSPVTKKREPAGWREPMALVISLTAGGNTSTLLPRLLSAIPRTS